MARDDMMQFLDGGRCVAVMVDGKMKWLSERKRRGGFVSISAATKPALWRLNSGIVLRWLARLNTFLMREGISLELSRVFMSDGDSGASEPKGGVPGGWPLLVVCLILLLLAALKVVDWLWRTLGN